MLIDCHNHTLSSDGRSGAEEIAKAVIDSKLDGIIFSDHHLTLGRDNLLARQLIRDAGKWCELGCEFSTLDGHLLVFGLDIHDLKLPTYPPMQIVIDAVNKAGGVAIPSHPFRPTNKYRLGDKLYEMKGLAAIEVENGQAVVDSPWANDKAREAAVKMHLPQMGGSDAHEARYIGTSYTVFDNPLRDMADFVEAVKAGEFHPEVDEKRAKKALKEREGAAKRLRERLEGEQHEFLEWQGSLPSQTQARFFFNDYSGYDSSGGRTYDARGQNWDGFPTPYVPVTDLRGADLSFKLLEPPKKKEKKPPRSIKRRKHGDETELTSEDGEVNLFRFCSECRDWQKIPGDVFSNLACPTCLKPWVKWG